MAKKSQIQKFREMSRRLEADESLKRFDAALKKMAKAPPPNSQSKSRKRAPKRV